VSEQATNEKEIFFSVIIPTFNRAHLIAKTIKSFLAQTYGNFELIIVDDGSSDNTREVVTSFSDDRVNYVWKQNGERGAARNYGASLAKGNYLNFFDSDDLAYPNHLAQANLKLQTFEYPDFYYQLGEIKDASGKLLRRGKLPENPQQQILKENFLLPNGVFIAPTAFSKVRYSENRLLSGSEDGLLYILLFMENKLFIDKTVTHCLVEHDGRSMNRNNIDIRSLQNRHAVFVEELRKNDQFMARHGAETLAQIDLAFCKYISVQLAVKGQGTEAARYWAMALRHDFSTVFSKHTATMVKYLLMKGL
jgi:glycosyltransferase involved in cell wall biosynthesis